MIKYLFVNDVETSVNELVLKVDYIYCCEDDNFLSDNNNDYIPNKGDKLYFMPGVNVPRVKLKDLSLKYGIKSVRDIEDATHVFYGKNTKDKMLNNHWYYNIPTETLRKIYDESEGIMDEYYRENLREALEHYTEDIVIVGYGIAARLRNSSLDVLTRNIASATLSSSSIYYSISEDYRDLFPNILNTEVYHESKLLKYINGADATVIDETMFLQLCDMFNSSDQDNHIIAMEIMANCNYMESLLYIEMLFEKYSNYMANCNTKNHVNFKSLISFLGKYKNYMGTSIVDVMNSLKEKQVLDIEKVNVIMKYYAKEIADSGGNEYFEIKSITLNEETAKLLNTNYVHELIQDFIPEVTEDLPQYPVNETEHEEILGEDIEIALARIERKHLKSTLIELEKQNEEVSNNNQIKEDNGDSFEWF